MPKSRLIPNVLASASLLVGCSSKEAPKVQNPRVENAARIFNMPKLAEQAVRSNVDFQVGSTVNHLIDLSGELTDQDRARIERTQAYIAQLVSVMGPANVEVTSPIGEKISFMENVEPSVVAERSYIFMTEDLWEKTFGKLGIEGGVTYTGDSETVSLIELDHSPNSSLPKVDTSVIATAVELCQSETEILTNVQVNHDIQAILPEALCNGVGRAVASHQSDATHTEYYEAFGGKPITQSGYVTTMYTFDAAAYANIPG